MAHPLWRPPFIHSQRSETETTSRKVTWLELFYDLVYVAALIQLGNALSHDLTMAGFLRFVLLFVAIWWSWIGVTIYMNRFIVDDLWQRLMVFVQIFGIAVLASSVEGAYHDLATQFVLAYVLIRALLVLMYVRSALTLPEARRFSSIYAIGYAIGAAIWLVSVFTTEQTMHLLWIVGMGVELLVPIAVRRVRSFIPLDREHLSERFGTFTIIVLGETFIKTIGEASGMVFGIDQVLFSTFGLIVTYSLWWLYFDDIAGSLVKPGRWATYRWVYMHLPLGIGITMFGVAAKDLYLAPLYAPLQDEFRLLYAASLVIYLIAVGVIDETTIREDHETTRNTRRRAIRFAAAGIIAIMGIFGTGMTTLSFIMLTALIFGAQVVLDLRGTRTMRASSIAIGDAA